MNLTDDQVVLLASTVADKVAHLKSSPETKQMFEEMNKKQESTDRKVEKLGFTLDLHINDNKHFNEETSRKLDDLKKIVESGLKEKANKWVESSMKLVAVIVVTAVIGALMKKIFID